MRIKIFTICISIVAALVTNAFFSLCARVISVAFLRFLLCSRLGSLLLQNLFLLGNLIKERIERRSRFWSRILNALALGLLRCLPLGLCLGGLLSLSLLTGRFFSSTLLLLGGTLNFTALLGSKTLCLSLCGSTLLFFLFPLFSLSLFLSNLCSTSLKDRLELFASHCHIGIFKR